MDENMDVYLAWMDVTTNVVDGRPVWSGPTTLGHNV